MTTIRIYLKVILLFNRIRKIKKVVTGNGKTAASASALKNKMRVPHFVVARSVIERFSLANQFFIYCTMI
jgi:hypothetical protein